MAVKENLFFNTGFLTVKNILSDFEYFRLYPRYFDSEYLLDHNLIILITTRL